jgi:hypothetical protein
MVTIENRKDMINAYKTKKDIGGICKITNTINGKILLFAAPNLAGAKNRFDFACKTNSCYQIELTKDWQKYGAEAFCFEVKEELEKLPEQTNKEFRSDLKELLLMWQENIGETLELY